MIKPELCAHDSVIGSGACRVNVDSELYFFDGISVTHDSVEGWKLS